MNFFVLIFFIWMGFYGQIMNYLKQALFQGKDIAHNPQLYLKDTRFLMSALALAVFAQGVWIIEVLIRQKLKLSSTMAYSVLISAPIAAVMQLVVLWLSEKYLADSINWWGAGILATGTILSMIGGRFLLK